MDLLPPSTETSLCLHGICRSISKAPRFNRADTHSLDKTIRDEPNVIAYVPWYIQCNFRLSLAYEYARPRVRERLRANPRKYCNTSCVTSLSNAVRFIWPFSTETALVGGHDGQALGLSDEVLGRATNIRSFVVAKDFLDQYVEFRGEMAQLEPSLTLYSIREQQNLEGLYWKMMRERRPRIKSKHPDNPLSTSLEKVISPPS